MLWFKCPYLPSSAAVINGQLCPIGHLNYKMISMGTELGVKLFKMTPRGLVPGHLVQN